MANALYHHTKHCDSSVVSQIYAVKYGYYVLLPKFVSFLPLRSIYVDQSSSLDSVSNKGLLSRFITRRDVYIAHI